MDFVGKNIFRNVMKNNDDLTLIREELEKLKENIFYGQQLANTGSWTHDIKNDEIFLSDEVYHILDSSPEEFDGKLESYYLYVHPDDLEEVKKETTGALEGKEYDIEYRIISSGGTVRYVHEKTKALYNENKEPIKMIGIIQDITNYKLIENDLKVISEDLNQAQRVAGIGFWKHDVIKEEIFWSDEVYKIFGITTIHFKKNLKSIYLLIHNEDRLKVQNAVDKCLVGKGYELEYRIPQQEGLVKYVVSKGQPIFDKERNVVGILGAIQDITENRLLEQKLKKSHKNFSKAQSLAHIGSWEYDIIHNKNYWSDETYKIFGITPENFDNTYEGFLNLVHPDDVKIIKNDLKNPSTEPFGMEFRIIRPDGSVRNTYQQVEFVFNKDDKPIHIYGTIQDITEKKELQKAIKSNQEEINKIQKKFQVLIQESSDIFEILSPDGTIKFMSEAGEKVIGYSPKERIGKKVYEYYEGSMLQKVKKILETVLDDSDRKVQEDIIFKTKEGNSIYLEVYMQNLLHEPAIEGIVVNFRDITKRVEMEKRMIHISTHDELTGLPNKVYFKKQLRMQCLNDIDNKYNRFALMMLDIKGLKYINDSLGDELVEQLIVEIVQKLRAFLGNETFISRYSDAYFAILVQESKTIHEYENIAKGIIELFANSYKLENYVLDLWANIGVCIYPMDSEDMSTLVSQSRVALLRARKDGKNTYKFHSSELNIYNYKEFVLRNDLHYAIERGQLRVYYQPMVNLKTNKLVAAEALIRWEHPDWGMVSPDDFISLAEETGLIIDIGKWILKEVCINYKYWLGKNMPTIKVSVNFSGIQLFEDDFVKNIISIIDEYELDAKFLIMEITESVLMKNIEKAARDIQKLQSFGVQVALDDFGTGFSSLAYLNSLKIDILKIDGSFIRNIPSDDTCTAIVRSVINLAKELEIKLVAEEIENWEQLSYLKEFNCDTGQGYIFSMPVSSEDFAKIMIKGKCKPIVASDALIPREDRRKFFRIKFYQLLEAKSTILELKGKKINVGNTKVLIKNIGPGGLCFISNIKFPVEREVVLQFTTELMEKEVKVYGSPVWVEEVDKNLYEYGVEYTLGENDRDELIKALNQVSVKMKNNIMFADGSFISGSFNKYFS